MNVLYQFSKEYLPVAASSISSLLEKNTIDKIYCLISDDFYELSKLIKNQFSNKTNIIALEAKKYDKICEKVGFPIFRGSYATYYKIVALDDIDEKDIVYLDSDTIICDDINVVIDKSKTIGACYDSICQYHLDNIGYNNRKPYFNCGVLYIDLQRWKKNNYKEKILQAFKSKNGMFLADQDIINLCLSNDVCILPARYNLNSGFYIHGINGCFFQNSLNNRLFYSKNEIKEAMENPAILHCMGAATLRPWEKDNCHPQKGIFSSYYDKLSNEIKEIKMISNNKSIENLLYNVLPSPIYNIVHKTALKYYYYYKESKSSK